MRPPNHRITAPLRIIDLDDPAWDADRFNAEVADLEGEQLRAHPIMAYRLGVTHFDLDAPGLVVDEDGEERWVTPREYLHETAQPVVYEARRLSPLEVANCQDRGHHVGQLWAFQLACKRVEGCPGLEYSVPPRKPATDAQVQAVADALGVDVVLNVGRAVLAASRAPSPAEGKRSGSSPGASSPGPGVSPAASSPGTASATA